jgi:hypothetical protein
MRLLTCVLVLVAAAALPGCRSAEPDAAPASAADAQVWRPAPSTTWQWQLDSRVDTSVPAQMYDVDLFDTPRRVVRALRARGRRTVCYFSAGSLERWRPDAGRFPRAVVGQPLDGWPGERWLDIRRIDALAPIVRSRLDLCRAKGFDGVEPDNVDGYDNATGFRIRAADQLRFNRFLAREAHARGLSVGLKNDVDQAAALEPSFDWALVEECFRYRECEALAPFVRAGKAVFSVEYDLATRSFCDRARRLGFMAMRKRSGLGAWRRTCW